MLTALPAWTLHTEPVIPEPKFSEVGQRDERWSPEGSEKSGVVHGRRKVRTAEMSCLLLAVSRLRGEMVSVSVPRGEGRLSGDISVRSHSRWSRAELTSCTAARLYEADWASFPTSAAEAIVRSLSSAFRLFVVSHSSSSLSLWIFVCLTVKKRTTTRIKRKEQSAGPQLES